jgi:type II secretory pathway pseudopilin PulG
MKSSHSGFSLIEVALALGVISFAILGIMGLFPVAMKSAQESREQTQSAFIVQQILGQLRSGVATNTVFPITSNPASGSNLSVNLAAQGTKYAVLDSDGQFIGGGANSAPATGVSPGVFLAILNVQPITVPSPGASKVTIDVCYPAAAPAASRTTNAFVTFMRNTAP